MAEKIDSLPFEIKSLDEMTNKQLLEDYPGERTGFVRAGPSGYLFASNYVKEAQELYNFKPRPDDTWVVTFPRSGTTLIQEMVWLISNNLDYETAGKIPQGARFPFLEFTLTFHEDTINELIKENESDPEKVKIIKQVGTPAYRILEKVPTTTRRFIKTHLPFSLLPKNLLEVGCKVIYVARNPKDVAVSFYHLHRLFYTINYTGDFSQFWDYFERSMVQWTPYWDHLSEGWELKSHPNVLFLFYEDMKKDLKVSIGQVAEFLIGQQLSKEDTDRLAKYLDISNFRDNPIFNLEPLRDAGMMKRGEQGFIRKGKTGSWVEEFTPELSERADKWIKENLRHTDLRFPGMTDL